MEQACGIKKHYYFYGSCAWEIRKYCAKDYAGEKGLKYISLFSYTLMNMITIIKKGMPKEDIRKKIDQIISKGNKKNIMPLAGKLKTSIDPLEFQKKMRNEWE